MRALKVGLLVESVQADKYVEELALWARGRSDIALCLVVQPQAKRASPWWWGFEKTLLRSSRCHRDHYAVRELSGVVEVRQDARDLDLLVSFSGESAPGARLGTVAVVCGGFWECYYGAPQTGFAIRRLGEDAADLARGWFRTRFYYSLNRAQVCKKSVAHLKSFLRRVAASGALPKPVGETCAVNTGAQPNPLQLAAYAGKLLGRIARKLFLRERFGVSVVLPGKRFVAPPLPREREWADPFLWTRGGRTYCFVEELPRSAAKAHISVLELEGTRLVHRGVALAEPFHLSFPFLFEHAGELYMCPETSAAREIRLYRCTGFPLQWRLEKTLMRDVSAADTVLFPRGGKWWMLTNIDESETGDHNSELYLFSADSPLSASWVAHPQNPILVDSIGGRNGGLVLDGERLFRLGQCQGFDRYGEGLRVYEIGEISAAGYAEELVAEIRPQRDAGIVGTHHLSTDGRITVIDYLKWTSATAIS